MNINKAFIDGFLFPIAGGADIDEEIEKYGDIDNNNEIEVKEIIAEKIKPNFENWSLNKQERARLALSYYLTTNKLDFRRKFDSYIPAFELPDNPHDFFKWIWEVIFPGENYEMSNWREYAEISDMDEV